MATVTGITAQRAKEIEDASIVGGTITDGILYLTTGAGAQVPAGQVVPPQPTLANAWPVGSIFLTVNASSPASLLGGGTWVRWGQGRVPISLDAANTAFDTINKTGGAASAAIGIANMPNHSHNGSTGTESADHSHSGSTGGHSADHSHTGYATSDGGHEHSYQYRASNRAVTLGGGASLVDPTTVTANTGGGGGHGHNIQTNGASADHSHAFGTGGISANHSHAVTAQGGGVAISTLPPYIVCYMWQRTA